MGLLVLTKPVTAQEENDKLDERTQIALTRAFINAEKDYQIKQYEAAIKGYDKCLTIDPKHAASYFGLGRLFLERQMYLESEENFEKAANLDPENKWYWLSLGQALIAQDKYKEASKVYKKLVEQHPDDIQIQLDYANTLLFAGKGKQAMARFDEIEEELGPNLDISRKKYQYFINEGKYDEAAHELEKLLVAFPDDNQIYGMLADLYKAQGKLDDALDVYRRANAADPTNPYVQLSLAEHYDRNSQQDSSFFYLRKAYLNPNLDIDTKVGVLIKMYNEAQRYPRVRSEALMLCEAVVESHPGDAKSYSVYGDYLLLDGQLEEARTQYLEAVELDPSKFPIWNQIMIIDSELGNNLDLLEDSKRALEYFPAQPSLYFFNGIANNQEGNHQEAAKVLREGVKFVFGNNPLSAQMLASLGDAYHELDRPVSSDSAYDASLSYDPNNLYVLNNYSYFLSLRGERLEEAKLMSEKTVTAQPTNASYLDTYGWILFKLGDLEGAEEYLRKALDNGGDQSSEVLDHYGDVSAAMGDKNGALTYWKMALEKVEDQSVIQGKIDAASQVE